LVVGGREEENSGCWGRRFSGEGQVKTGKRGSKIWEPRLHFIAYTTITELLPSPKGVGIKLSAFNAFSHCVWSTRYRN